MQQDDSFDLLRSRCFDLWEQFDQKGRRGFLGFLTPFEAETLSSALPAHARRLLQFWGGYEGAERVMLTFGETVSEEDFPISLMVYHWPKQDSLSHRDVLGALMGAGISRACLGDILLQEGSAAVFVRSRMAPVLEEVEQIGRIAVKGVLTEQLPHGFEQKREALRASVSSLRLDCLLSTAAHLARGKAEEAIEKKLVSVNGQTETRCDRKLKLPATVSMRGVGKFRLISVAGETKKGRLLLDYEKFL